MTRLLTCGWETGDIAEIGGGAVGTQSVVTSTPTPRSPGTYCIKFGTGAATRDISIGTAKTDVWFRCGIYLHALAAEGVPILQVFDSAGTSNPNMQGSLTWSNSDQLLRVYRGLPSGTLLGTSTLQFSQDQWHGLEVRWQITSATVGTVEVWIDDTQWLNLTSIDNTNSTTLNVLLFRIGSNSTIPGGGYIALDDMAINDTTAATPNNTRIGDGRVVLLKPNGAGSNTAQTRGGTDTGANWSQCSERPPSLTQYVFSATAATRDTYALEDVPAGAWTVNCCEVLAYAQNSDAGAGSLGLTVKSGSTTSEGSAQSLTTSAGYYRRLLETDPDTSAAWTVSAVSALEAGTTVR